MTAHRGLILGGVSLAALLAPAPALADPVSLTIAGINALLSTSVTATTALLTTAAGTTLLTVGQAVGAALAVGASFLATALGGSSGRAGAASASAAAKETSRTSETGEWVTLGKDLRGGVEIYKNAKGLSRWRLVAHSRAESGGVEEYYLGGRPVIVEADGAVSSVPWARPGGSYAYIYYKPGSGRDTAWPQLVAAFPGVWTEAHRVSGLSQSLLHFISPGTGSDKYLKLYSGGPPKYQVLELGLKIYDPRDGVTRWSDNGVLCVLHILVAFLKRPLSGFHMPSLIAAANRADELVRTRTGAYEPRCRFWGSWNVRSISQGQLLKDALMSTGLDLVPVMVNNVKYDTLVFVDDNRPPQIHYGRDDIINFALTSGTPGNERPNRLRLKYRSPERRFEIEEILLVQDPTQVPVVPLDWAIDQQEIDRGTEQVMEIVLPFCPSAAQAQRIGRRLFALARADAGEADMNMKGMAAFGCRTVSFEDVDSGATVIGEILPPRVNGGTGTVNLTFAVQPALPPWDPAVHEALPPPLLVDLAVETNVVTPPAAVQAVSVTLHGSGVEELRVAYALPPAGHSVEAVYRVRIEGVFGPWHPMTEYVVAPDLAYAAAQVNVVDAIIEFRSRYYNAAQETGAFSEVATFTVLVAAETPPPPIIVQGNLAPDETLMPGVIITMPSALNIVAVTQLGGIGPSGTSPPDTVFTGTFAARPGDVIQHPVPQQPSTIYTYRARSVGTGGNLSAFATVTWTTPDPPPGGGGGD